MPGIELAPADYALTASPTWQRIDLDYAVQSWSIDRGRPNEMSRTDTGTAQINLVDKTGDFDPTNTTGAFYGRLNAGQPMGPLVQAQISLQNPTGGHAWFTLFRGFISQIQWQPYQTEQWANVTISLVDAMALFAAMEMVPGAFGDDYVDGNILFNEDLALTACQTRINKVLDDAHWPTSLRVIFTGNVQLLALSVAPRSTVLQVLEDTADAEFPDMANLFVGCQGRGSTLPGSVVFHGRYARFQPAEADYQIATWQCGDDQAAAADPTNVVRISPPLVASLDDTSLYTSALATPQGIADGDIEAQYVQDAAGAAQIGLRSWSAENLLTRGGITAPVGGTPTDGVAETKRFAQWVVDNYSTTPIAPTVRVGQLTIKTRDPASTYGPATWSMVCGVEISDIVHLTTTHSGGGGFNHDFYIEGIHYNARPGGLNPYIELTLDVSPKGYYGSFPT